jgi:hypothetical protein
MPSAEVPLDRRWHGCAAAAALAAMPERLPSDPNLLAEAIEAAQKSRWVQHARFSGPAEPPAASSHSLRRGSHPRTSCPMPRPIPEPDQEDDVEDVSSAFRLAELRSARMTGDEAASRPMRPSLRGTEVRTSEPAPSPPSTSRWSPPEPTRSPQLAPLHEAGGRSAGTTTAASSAPRPKSRRRPEGHPRRGRREACLIFATMVCSRRRRLTSRLTVELAAVPDSARDDSQKAKYALRALVALCKRRRPASR